MSIPAYHPIFHDQGKEKRIDPPGVRRDEIIDYIKQALGEHLAAEYDSAIHSSVSTGCYDADWAQLGGVKVTQYIATLRADWLSKQGDVMPLVLKVLHLLAYGSDKEKHQLRTLLKLEQTGD